MTPSSRIGKSSQSYLLFTLILSVLALLSLAVEVIARPSADVRVILRYADAAVCLLFFIDFLILFIHAENRLKYMLTWGWLDLLSSVPAIEVFRIGRMARVVRILRVLRGIRSARVLSSAILERRAQSALLASILICVILVTIGSISVLQFEDSGDANIKTPEDAMWWTIVTLTTVGYGDKYPISSEGRIVAAILMVAGVGLFGTLSGFVASWFLSPLQKEEQSEMKRIETEIANVRRELEALRQGIILSPRPPQGMLDPSGAIMSADNKA